MNKIVLSIILLIGALAYFSRASQGQFEKVDTSDWNPEIIQKYFYAEHETEMLRNITHLIGSEGEFRGTIKQYKPSFDSNQIIIEVHEDYVPDDSIETIDHRFIAEKKNQSFEIVEYYKKYSNH